MRQYETNIAEWLAAAPKVCSAKAHPSRGGGIIDNNNKEILD